MPHVSWLFGHVFEFPEPAGTLNVNITDSGIGATVLASQAHAWANTRPNLDLNFRIAYTSISLSLNVLLTLMILVRLVLRAENVRAATGSPAGLSRLYKTIATVFIESSALYAVNSLLLIGVRIADSSAEAIFLPVLGQVQVRVFPWP